MQSPGSRTLVGDIVSTSIRANTLHLVYVDSYHSGDSIFLNDLGRTLVTWRHFGRTAIIVQNPKERIQRYVESKGLEYSEVSEVSSELIPELRRVILEANKQLVAQLTEVGLSAVGILGSDRSTVSRAANGEIIVKKDWLRKLAIPGVVPVVAPLVDSGGRSEPIGMGELLASLANAMETPVTMFPRGAKFSGSKGLELERFHLDPIENCFDIDEIRRISSPTRLFLTHPKALKMAKIEGVMVSVPN